MRLRRTQETEEQPAVAAFEDSPSQGATAPRQSTTGDDGEKTNPFKRALNKALGREEEEGDPLAGTLAQYPHLLAIKPKEKYEFESDYIRIDKKGTVAVVLTFVHNDSADDGFAPFWGVRRIPSDMGDGVRITLIDSHLARPKSWVEGYQRQNDTYERMQDNEANTPKSSKAQHRRVKSTRDLQRVNDHLFNGDSYIHVQYRLLVTAKDLETLEQALDEINRLYLNALSSLKVRPYEGAQRKEFSQLLAPTDKRRGKGFHFTSTELAGSYALVSAGLADEDGEYIGASVRDYNNPDVIFNVDRWDDHIVIGHSGHNDHPTLGRMSISSMWGSKIAQSAMLNQRRVAHLVLDSTKLDHLGPQFANRTSRISMSDGDVNMFEMFGSDDRALEIFAMHVEKITLMLKQMYTTSAEMESIIEGRLSDILTAFYVDQRMWSYDAKNSRDDLRIVGLAHTSYPRLHDFMAYVTSELAKDVKDPDMCRAINTLGATLRKMVDTYGGIFDTFTSDNVDLVSDRQRMIYDFSEIYRTNERVAMAQFVNVIAFAVDALGVGDTVIIHGAEALDPSIRGYVTKQLDRFVKVRKGRVAYLYNDIDKMLNDASFNGLTNADYTVIGYMHANTAQRYQEVVRNTLPPELESVITTPSERTCYVRRGFVNTPFVLDFPLGLGRAVTLEQERAALLEAQRVEREARERAMEASRSRTGSLVSRRRSVIERGARSLGRGAR